MVAQFLHFVAVFFYTPLPFVCLVHRLLIAIDPHQLLRAPSILLNPSYNYITFLTICNLKLTNYSKYSRLWKNATIFTMLSVVFTVWNEEANLARAITSIKKLADEIIVVDTGSTDKTVDIAKKNGCKVFHHPFTGIVEPARNFSIAKAAGDWILLLDADEEIPSALAAKIKSLIATPAVDYYRIPRKNIIFNQWITTDHWWPDYVYRLFRKGYIHWQEEIHSVPLVRGNGSDLPALEENAILHHNYSSISQFLTRMDRYTDFQYRTLLSSGYSFSWPDLLVQPSREFLLQFYARRGYRLGLHGLALSLLQAFSMLVVYLKVWQSGEFVTYQTNASQVTQTIKKESRDWTWWFYQSQIETHSFPVNLLWRLRRTLKI